jgi:hypothetical protein
VARRLSAARTADMVVDTAVAVAERLLAGFRQLE